VLRARSYTSAQLAVRYGFPVVSKATDQYVAIIELTSPQSTTGWSENDFKAYCGQASMWLSPLHSATNLRMLPFMIVCEPTSTDAYGMRQNR